MEKKQSRAENRFWTGSRIPIRSQSLGNLHAHFLSGSCNICVRVINIYVCTRYLSRYWPKASASGMASKQSPTAVSCNLWPFFKFCTRTCNYVAANEANRLPAFVMPQTNRQKKKKCKKIFTAQSQPPRLQLHLPQAVVAERIMQEKTKLVAD